ncbi:MAG TPA: DUF2922 domain-containing protein [Syntrophomonadaceae bacterium]|nr:DUF2922 domain-containing protein [Syntrophomonadaceae bacterium]HOQ09548.1 DUF2922 domain-containing protein [Syntrophomonadaceae bacterium]HPU48041.1 DUF2922 domain-containing protein [Syntrophomonadaceae bacterium]
MAIQRVLQMDFTTELGRNHRIRVYDAREDLTSEEVSAAMDQIVAGNIFSGNGGALTGKARAQMIVSETTEFDLV